MIVSEWLKARFRSDRIGNVVFWVRWVRAGAGRGWELRRVLVSWAGGVNWLPWRRLLGNVVCWARWVPAARAIVSACLPAFLPASCLPARPSASCEPCCPWLPHSCTAVPCTATSPPVSSSPPTPPHDPRRLARSFCFSGQPLAIILYVHDYLLGLRFPFPLHPLTEGAAAAAAG